MNGTGRYERKTRNQDGEETGEGSKSFVVGSTQSDHKGILFLPFFLTRRRLGPFCDLLISGPFVAPHSYQRSTGASGGGGGVQQKGRGEYGRGKIVVSGSCWKKIQDPAMTIFPPQEKEKREGLILR